MTELTTSEQWAVDIILHRRKRELEALLKQHSADEVKRILAARRVAVTRHLADGRWVEAEAEQKGGQVRLRARLCQGGLVRAAFRVTETITELMTRREFLPKEFSRDPVIAQATMEPIEEIWKHRLRLG
jgi:hypothetical protein